MVKIEDLCFIIKELMVIFCHYVYIDYVIKCPYNPTSNEINLQDIKLITIPHLNEKLNSSYDENDKFKKERNIISAYIDKKNHNINIINPNHNEKENNSIIQIKKGVNHLNLATNDYLARNNIIELPKIGAKKPRIFKNVSFNNISETNKNTNKDKNEGAKIKKYSYDYDDDDYQDNDSRENSHRLDNNYLNYSYAISASSKYKDSKLNTIGKTYNDLNINDINQMANVNNLGSNVKILTSYKEKQISPSTATTEKSYYNRITNSKRVLNDSEIGTSLSNFK